MYYPNMMNTQQPYQTFQNPYAMNMTPQTPTTLTRVTGIDEDLVPESNIDESIGYLMKLFVTYYNNKNVDTLKPLLINMKQILSELYHTCNTNDERELFKQLVPEMSNIL